MNTDIDFKFVKGFIRKLKCTSSTTKKRRQKVMFKVRNKIGDICTVYAVRTGIDGIEPLNQPIFLLHTKSDGWIWMPAFFFEPVD